MQGATYGARVRQSGVTVIEVVVGVLILVLLIGITAPSFQEYHRNRRLNKVSNDLMVAVQLARAQAVRRQKIVSMCPTGDATRPSPKCGDDPSFAAWIVFEDGDGDCLPVAGEVPIQARTAVPSDEISHLSARGNGVCVSFATNGSLRAVPEMRNADRFLLCDPRGIGTPFGTDPSPARGIVLDPSGRVSQTRQTDTIRLWRVHCPFANH